MRPPNHDCNLRQHIAPPPLSPQIKALEGELGVRLLNRSTRKVELATAWRKGDASPVLARVLARAQALCAADPGVVVHGMAT